MKQYIIRALVFLGCATSSVSLFAQCGDRYETEIFTETVKTTVQYSHYEVRPNNGNFLKMDIYEPVGDTFAMRPVVIMAHGGTFIAGDRNEGTSTEVAIMAAKRGYVGASIDYRLAGSQAELFDSINALRIALRAVSDMKAAVRYFRQDAATSNTFRIDTTQIFVGGNSAGAITAVHVAYVTDTNELPGYIKSLVTEMGGIDGNSGNPGYASHVSGVINLAGGINKTNWIQAGDVPMVSCHGTNDQTVPYGCKSVLYPDNFLFDLIDICGSGAMKSWCDQVGTDNILHPYQGDGHVPWESNATKRQTMMTQVGDFLKTYTVCNNVGVGLADAENPKMLLFPNPADNYLRIALDMTGEARIEIFDSFGKSLMQVSGMQQHVQLDIAALPAGFYLLRFAAGKNIVTKPFVKM